MVFREIFQPCLSGLLVEGCPIFLGTLEYGGIEFCLVYLVNFREKFPSPGDGLSLEIVAEAPVSEHLEHRMVIGIVSYFLEVIVLSAHAEAFL